MISDIIYYSLFYIYYIVSFHNRSQLWHENEDVSSYLQFQIWFLFSFKALELYFLTVLQWLWKWIHLKFTSIFGNSFWDIPCLCFYYWEVPKKVLIMWQLNIIPLHCIAKLNTWYQIFVKETNMHRKHYRYKIWTSSI